MRWLSCCFYAVSVALIAANPLALAELTGHWTFDDGSGTTLTDSSANGLNGTLVGSPTWATGHTGTAGDFSLSFDGSNYVSLGNPSELAIIGDQTISLWIYPTDKATRRNPYAKSLCRFRDLDAEHQRVRYCDVDHLLLRQLRWQRGPGQPGPVAGPDRLRAAGDFADHDERVEPRCGHAQLEADTRHGSDHGVRQRDTHRHLHPDLHFARRSLSGRCRHVDGLFRPRLREQLHRQH